MREKNHNFITKTIFIIIFSGFIIIPNNSLAYLSDSGSHPPPSSGTYQYSPPGTFMPNNSGFPAAGQSYVDPVFGETITRITNYYGTGYQGEIQYSDKWMINANSTMMLVNVAGLPNRDIYTLSGTRLRQDIPLDSTNDDFHWHPTNPDKIVYLSGNQLKEYSFSTNSNTVLHTWQWATNNGGSGKICDETGRYYVAMKDGGTSVTVWDRTDNVEYTAKTISNGETPSILPDGSGILVAYIVGYGGVSYFSLNHTNRTIGSGTQIADHSAHGCIVKDSTGKTWIVYDGNPVTSPPSSGVIMKVNVKNPSEYSAVLNISHGWNYEMHISANIVSPSLHDWISIAIYDCAAGLTIDSTPWDPWYEFQNEIYLYNIVTGEVRRLANHRSRSNTPNWDYYWMAKPSISADGKYVAFSSNGGRVTPGYCDAYIVTTGLAPSTCSQLGGIDCCTGGETCSGTSYSGASDCSGVCCSQTCVQSPTCQNQGYQCCSSCQSDPHPEYDSTCPGQVCCQTCQPPSNTIECRKTSAKITVDGNIDEFLSASHIDFSGSDNTASVYCLWDDSNLYFAFDVADSQLNSNNRARDTVDIYLDDTAEIYIDTLNNKGSQMQTDDYQFLVNIRNNQGDLRGTGSGKDSSWNSAFQSGVNVSGTIGNNGDTDTGYKIEFQIPWSDIGGSPSSGQTMGLDLAVDDMDASHSYFDWAGIAPDSFAQPERWYNISFRECHKSDTNCDSCVDMQELQSFINLWKQDSTAYPIRELIEAIGLWKSGC